MAEKFEYTREWTDAKAFPLLGFTKSWENPEDYPTIELDETQVRKDMQSLHDEVKNYINDKLIPAVLAEDATEEARAAAEAQREANENQRIENENARIASEQARTTAESARADAETERAAAESARNTAEQAREAAEQARADETAGIVAQATEQAVIASNAASEASSSASGASTSASAAAASASSASDSASASASSATAAQASADEALSSKNSAKSEADRAKSEADRAAEIVGGDFVKSSEKGAANGVATLDADALLAAAQRPKAGGLYRDDGKTTLEKSLAEISTTLQKKADSSSVYSKDESISASTRTALSLPETATPDAALAEIARKLPDTVESVDYPGCYYRMVDGVTEWVNPPMVFGSEYRTTDRYNEKPVYVKVVDCGAISASATKTVAHNISNLFYIVGFFFTMQNSAYTEACNLPVINYNSNTGCANISGPSIKIVTSGSHLGYTNSYAIIKYTKTTD